MISLRSASISRRAFTLLELLVVISIIAVLAGILLPVSGSVMENARKVQAKNTEVQIVNAIKSFQTDYGVYPVPTTADPNNDYVFGDNPMTMAQLMNVLRANNIDPAPTINPRAVAYFEMPAAKNQTAGQSKNGIGADGFPYDPWGKTYYASVDSNYDNGIKNPYGGNHNAGFDPIGTGVVVVSYGKDKASSLSWGGGGTDKNTGNNADDIISWQ